MNIMDIFHRNQARIGREKLTPLGLAIEKLNVVVDEGKRRKIKSETFDAVEIILDSLHKHREALQAAGEFALSLTESTRLIILAENETVQGKKKRLNEAARREEARLPGLIEDFKRKSILAKMNQLVPPSDSRVDPGEASKSS